MESLLKVSQKCLFIDKESLSEDMEIHIYNLLEIAIRMLDKDRYDSLNTLATHAKAYREEKSAKQK